jgi:hypothetical protein
MQDAAAGGHPLHAARAEVAAVSVVVAMAHAAGEHVGHRFEATVRMLGKAFDVIVGLVGAELVEQQERVQHVERRLSDHALELHARAVGGIHAADAAGDVALGGHGGLLGWNKDGS